MSSPENPKLSRRVMLLGGAALGFVAVSGCVQPQRPRMFVVLLDQSGSVRPEDFEMYMSTMTSVVEALRARQMSNEADRILIASIGEGDFTRFASIADHTMVLKSTNLDREGQIQQKREAVLAEFSAMQPDPNSKFTRILDSLAGAAQIIAAAPEYAPELVLFSDMVEESPIADFWQNPPKDPAAIEALLSRLPGNGLMPDLKGARVHVIGGAGRDAEAYMKVQAFWTAYFTTAGAELVRYSRVALRF